MVVDLKTKHPKHHKNTTVNLQSFSSSFFFEKQGGPSRTSWPWTTCRSSWRRAWAASRSRAGSRARSGSERRRESCGFLGAEAWKKAVFRVIPLRRALIPHCSPREKHPPYLYIYIYTGVDHFFPLFTQGHPPINQLPPPPVQGAGVH